MSRRRISASGSVGPQPADAVVVSAISAVLGLTLLIWAWGGLAGAVLGSGWPRLGIAEALAVLVRLPGHLAAPALAWPARARPLLPGSAALYATLAVLAGALVALARLIARSPAGAWAGVRSAGSGAAWASGAELRALSGGRMHLLADGLTRHVGRSASPSHRHCGGGRLVLGRAGGRLLYAEERHALVAFGPPQSGKSAGLAVPALLEWAGPAIACSIKTDLLQSTLARRRALGETLVFDPFRLAGCESHTWSPLHGARTWDGALEVAWRLASAGELDQRGVDGGDFWAVAAEQRLAPLLFAAAVSGAGMSEVVRWAYGQDPGGLHRVLAELTGTARDERLLADAFAAYDAARAFDAQADRTRASIEATVQALLRAYRFTRVARSAGGSEITPERVLAQDATLYVVGDAKAAKLLRPILIALISEIVDHAYERATRRGGRLERPLLLCLDEAGNVAPLPNLAEIASTAPSHNIQIITIFHDLAQARSRYGRQAETVVNSHRARMLLPGVADLDTLRFFSSLAGDAEVQDRTYTSGAGGASRSVARRRVPLVAPEALRQLPAGQALLLYGRIAPVLVRLRMWFSDRRLRGLAAASGSHSQVTHSGASHSPPDESEARA